MITLVDVAPIALFLGLLLVSRFKKISFKFSVVIGICLLAVSAFASIEEEQIANLIAIFAYFSLLAGVLLAIIESQAGHSEENAQNRANAGRMQIMSVQGEPKRQIWLSRLTQSDNYLKHAIQSCQVTRDRN